MIEYLPFVLTGLGLTASILYYASVLRNANKTQIMQLETRQAQLFMGVFNQLQNKEIQEAWNWFRDNVTPENARDYMNPDHPDYKQSRAYMTRFSMFFEGLGTLVREELVPIRLVALMMQGMVRPYWETIREVAYEQRAKGYDSAGSELEHLYLAMMKYIEENPDFYKNK